MVSGVNLTELESFVLCAGRRPWLFMVFLAGAVAGSIMFFFDFTRLPGIALAILAVLALLLWSAWIQTFLAISAGALKVSGPVPPSEAIVFLERVQLASHAAKSGQGPGGVRAAVKLSGQVGAGCEVGDRPAKVRGQAAAKNDIAPAAKDE
jgi:hypothetical protein